MATELAPTNADRVQKLFEDLETQKNMLASCTQLFTTLSNHFASFQDSLSQKSQALDSKFQSLQSRSHQTLDSLSLREDSIPERESAAAARVEEQKESALAELQNPDRQGGEISESLKSLSRRIDASGLLKFIVAKRKESVALRAEISGAIMEAVDPPRLVLDAVEEFLSQKIGKGGVTDKRWACGMLVQALLPEADLAEKTMPRFSRSLVERARGISETWKVQFDGELQSGAMGPAEAVMFLQLVLGFGLKQGFDDGFLKKLVLDFASRRDMAKLASALGFGNQMGDIIEELIKTGKEIEAIYFASESGLTERFSPVSLLKSYLRNSKKNATNILKNGSYSARATEESNAAELNSIRAIIKCVEDHHLELEFSLDSLRKRVNQLETAKAEKKKSSASTARPQNKRGHGSVAGRSSGPLFRPAKAAKFSNAYPSFARRNAGPTMQHSPAGRYVGSYSYPGQSIYESASTISYASAYGPTHSQSPAAIPQQHYSIPVENVSTTTAGYRASGSYGGQASYGAYEYGSAAPATYQPPSYGQ